MNPIHHLSARPMMIYGPSLDAMKATAAEHAARPKAALVDTLGRAEALQTARLGSTAVIPIHGPIHGDETYANALMAFLFGGCGHSEIAAAIKAALDDESVDSIILDIDSPGGEALGTGELAAFIRQANGAKPITAYVSGMGCSAAYWLASACGRIVCDAMAMLGSIGTVVCFYDDKEYLAKLGVKEIEIVSSQSPHKRPDPSTPAGKAAYQAMVDDLSHVFIADVARYRGVSESTVLSDFGGGGVLIGAEAVKVGLADSVGSMQSTLASIRSSRPAPSPFARTSQTATQGTATVDILKFLGLASKADPAKLDAAAALLDAEPEAADPLPIGNAAPAEPAAESAEVVQLRASLAAAELKAADAVKLAATNATAALTAQIDKDVTAFTAAIRADARAVPAVASALEPLYRAALCVEKGQPVPDGFSLSAAVKAVADALPPHILTASTIASLPTGAVLVKQEDDKTVTAESAQKLYDEHYANN